jgi:hypothetical protein
MKAKIVNPLELPTSEYRHRGEGNGLWLFSFGAYGDHHLWVWASSIEDGLEEAAGALPKGYFADEPESEDEEEGLTYTESGWLTSHEWFVREASEQEFCRIYRQSALAYDREYDEEPSVPRWVKEICSKFDASARFREEPSVRQPRRAPLSPHSETKKRQRQALERMLEKLAFVRYENAAIDKHEETRSRKPWPFPWPEPKRERQPLMRREAAEREFGADVVEEALRDGVISETRRGEIELTAPAGVVRRARIRRR